MKKYDPDTREGGLFAEYINIFLKRKVDASGYRSWVQNSDDEEHYVTTFDARESVLMDRDAARLNAA